MTQFNMNHMRMLVNLAFDHVERARAEKATLELVEFEPNVRPTNLMFPDQCVEIIQSLLAEKRSIESWHKTGYAEVDLSHASFAQLSKDMQVFNVTLMQQSHTGTVEIAIVSKQGRTQ